METELQGKTPDMIIIDDLEVAEEAPVKKTRRKVKVFDEATGETVQVDVTEVEVAPKKKEEKHDKAIISAFPKTHIDVLEACIAGNTPALLVGHTGLGKTTLVQELANKHGKELIRLSVHSGITADEILGKWLAENGSTVWQDGLLVQAMKKGAWVVFDEINACPADVMFALHSLLDDARQVTLLEKRGEVIKPAEEFRFFATMNPPEDYAGTKEMNMAFMSRFSAVLTIEPYAKSVEKKILMKHGVSDVNAEMLVNVCSWLRKAKAEDKIMYFCGTRDLIHAGKMMEQKIDVDECIRFAIINKMSAEDREFVKQDKSFVAKNAVLDAKEQEIERLTNSVQNYEQALASARNDIGNFQQVINQKDSLINTLQAENATLKANPPQEAGVQLSADEQKALNLLRVLKKNP